MTHDDARAPAEGQTLRESDRPRANPLTGTPAAARYRLGAEIGRGGMGTVYAATQVNLERPVAIKVLRADLAVDADAMARFRQEALVVARLGHPNIVQVFDFEQPADGPPFLVMERLEGRPLKNVLAEDGPLPLARVVAIATQVLAALSAAHSAGVIHRDLKPDNVFLARVAGAGEVVKLLDFGIAKLLESPAAAQLTSTGMILGTPSYMAPEQVGTAPVDARTDLYALGVVLYEALAGVRPFTADTPTRIYNAILNDPVTPLRARRPDLPPALCAVVDRALAKRASERFASAAAMGDALVGAMRSVGAAATIVAQPPAWPGDTLPATVSSAGPVRRGARPALVAGALAGGALVVAVGATVAWRSLRARDASSMRAIASTADAATATHPSAAPTPLPSAPNALASDGAVANAALAPIAADPRPVAGVVGNHPVACAVDLLGEPPFPSVDSIRRSFHARCPAVVRCLERSGYVPSPGASSCWSFEIFGANDLHGDLDPYVDPRYARTPYIDACALPEVRHLDMPMPDRAGTLIACFRFASPDNAGGEP